MFPNVESICTLPVHADRKMHVSAKRASVLFDDKRLVCVLLWIRNGFLDWHIEFCIYIRFI